MATTGLAVFDTTINETNQWLKALEAELLIDDRHKAYLALRAVLHALRDRLSPGGAMRLGAQMPMLLRGLYVEGWRPDETPVRTHSVEAFAAKVAEELPPDFGFEPDFLARMVIRALWGQMSGGAMRKAREEVPEALRALWPDEAFVA